MPRFQWRQWLAALGGPCPAAQQTGHGVRANLAELRTLFADELERRDQQAWIAALERSRQRGARRAERPAAGGAGDLAAG